MKKEKTITDFLCNEYKDFAMYVIENRAVDFVSNWLPNLDDT